VIDVGSGEGYGAVLLAQAATSVTGIEIAAAAVPRCGASPPAETDAPLLWGTAAICPK
jgi:hypothetical protein